MFNHALLAATGVGVVVAIVAVLIVFMLLLVIMTRIKTCPSDKVLVVHGKIGKNKDGTYRSAKCMHGGVTLVVPFLQKYTFLDLTPLSISVDLKSALSKQNIRIDVPSIFTVGISTDPAIMQNAAERLLGLTLQNISELAKYNYLKDAGITSLDDAEKHRLMLADMKSRLKDADGKIREAVAEKKTVSDFYALYENQMKSDYQILLEQARAEIENIRRVEERKKAERERGEVQQESKPQGRGKSGFSI